MYNITQVGVGLGTMFTSVLVASADAEEKTVDIMDYVIITLPALDSYITVKSAIALITFGFGLMVSIDAYRKRQKAKLREEINAERPTEAP